MNGLLKVMKVLLTWFASSAEDFPVEKPKKETVDQTKSEILFKNDSDRLQKEYGILYDKNRNLYDLITDVALYCREQFNKSIVITMIDRTQAEQDEIYKNDPKYKEKPFKSPHQMWMAVDLRSSVFTPEEITKIENYLNTTYNSTNTFKWTARNHTVGLGFHFHVQYAKKV